MASIHSYIYFHGLIEECFCGWNVVMSVYLDFCFVLHPWLFCRYRWPIMFFDLYFDIDFSSSKKPKCNLT